MDSIELTYPVAGMEGLLRAVKELEPCDLDRLVSPSTELCSTSSLSYKGNFSASDFVPQID